MEQDIYIEPKLLKGEPLSSVSFVKELNCWALQSLSPDTRCIDEYEKIEQEHALEMYPELKELFELQPDRNVFFIKGKNSGKWIDFV